MLAMVIVIRSGLRTVRHHDVNIFVRSTNLVKILLTRLPGPLLTTKLSPVVKSSSRTGDPSVVVEARAAAEDLSSGIGLLNASVLGTINHASLERPIILGTSESEGSGGSRDGVNGRRVVNAGLDDEDGHVGVLGQAASNDAASSATFEAVSSVYEDAERGDKPPTTIKSKALGASVMTAIIDDYVLNELKQKLKK